jgi:hypothetical protein
MGKKVHTGACYGECFTTYKDYLAILYTQRSLVQGVFCLLLHWRRRFLEAEMKRTRKLDVGLANLDR